MATAYLLPARVDGVPEAVLFAALFFAGAFFAGAFFAGAFFAGAFAALFSAGAFCVALFFAGAEAFAPAVLFAAGPAGAARPVERLAGEADLSGVLLVGLRSGSAL
ncbi:hypothetical protein [Kitasatospora paranensis]|uniref:hypothetical protein n=1 Tax=Kitasatospora paranensis TaxID=258053 RepID=UPI0031EA67BE